MRRRGQREKLGGSRLGQHGLQLAAMAGNLPAQRAVQPAVAVG